MEILDLRLKLKTNYQNLFEILESRKLIIKDIFDQKVPKDAFDPKVEWEIFKNPQFKTKSLKELLAISLIIESQAADFGPYPRWSERVHLLESRGELFELLNPLLLRAIHPILFERLRLKLEYSDLKNYE